MKLETNILVTRKWRGSNLNHPLKLFICQHHAAFASIQSCAVHVNFQLPNGHTRIGYLLDTIKCNNAPLLAAVVKVEEENSPTGKRKCFEKYTTHLLPKNPVIKKRLIAAK